jgi:hypothetical protein
VERQDLLAVVTVTLNGELRFTRTCQVHERSTQHAPKKMLLARTSIRQHPRTSFFFRVFTVNGDFSRNLEATPSARVMNPLHEFRCMNCSCHARNATSRVRSEGVGAELRSTFHQ